MALDCRQFAPPGFLFFWGPIGDRQPGARHGHGRTWEQVSTHAPGKRGVDSRGLKTFLATWLPFLVFTNLGARDYQLECGRWLGVSRDNKQIDEDCSDPMHLDGHRTRGGPCQMQEKRIRMRDTTTTAVLGYGFSTLSLLLPKRPVIWHVVSSVYDSRIIHGDSAVEPKWSSKCPTVWPRRLLLAGRQERPFTVRNA